MYKALFLNSFCFSLVYFSLQAVYQSFGRVANPLYKDTFFLSLILPRVFHYPKTSLFTFPYFSLYFVGNITRRLPRKQLEDRNTLKTKLWYEAFPTLSAVAFTEFLDV